MTTLPAKEEPVLLGVPPLHHRGQDSLHNLLLYICVSFQAAQQHHQTPIHICDTQAKIIIIMIILHFLKMSTHAFVCMHVYILTVILLPVDYSSSSQGDEVLSVFFGHCGAEHLERAQFALRHWEKTDQTQTIFNIQHHSDISGHITALNVKSKALEITYKSTFVSDLSTLL